ncbi:DUF1015 domain-containing protein [Ruminococcus sp. 5_1_39BFAA]|uniref:DUF1015 domain-containing protein n=1 Tax=Ruminococcus sp. 5_1_39BFAA TaxID=457412 RepID=UPI0035642836
MAVFRTFKALRPAPEKAARVAALPYDVVSREEAKLIGDENSDSFLHVDRAEMDLPQETDLYDSVVYEKARENLLRMEEDGTFIQDKKSCYYIYELVRKGKTQTGIVGCASIDDYLNNVVKKHELTREDKELDRIHHVDVCDANTGPIYLACRYTQELTDVIGQWKAAHAPVYDFANEDEIIHRVWVIDGEAEILTIGEEFRKISSIYIADGHHRAASAVKVGLKRRQENPGYTGEEEFNYFLSVVFPCEQLTILPYNRVVRDLNGLTEKAFLGSLKFNFELMAMPGFPCKPVEKHCMGMYLDGCWYHLKAWPDIYQKKDIVGQLDVEILQDRVLSPVLGIKDPRTDDRIRFVGGSHRLSELADMAGEAGVAFAMYPTSMEELMGIADEGKLMPPKSTWFEPKLRSGLFIHKLSD